MCKVLSLARTCEESEGGTASFDTPRWILEYFVPPFWLPDGVDDCCLHLVQKFLPSAPT
jgi:hypothetical protein